VKEPEPEPTYIAGIVRDKTTMQPMGGATVFVYNPVTGKVATLKTSDDGSYKMIVGKTADLVVKAMVPNYISDCTPLKVGEIKPGATIPAPRDLLLDKLVVNKSYKIENIYYNFDRYNIRADAESELEKLVTIMKENNINVELGSHTDSRGSFAYNDRLSQRRAESAVNYIIAAGIEKGRITAKGYGEHHLTNQCSDGVHCSEADHQANRRTEFRVISLNVDTRTVDQFNPNQFRSGDELDVRFVPGGLGTDCK
jgi:outer membrane protein OmpA-like peptidoglycan-associated protein